MTVVAGATSLTPSFSPPVAFHLHIRSFTHMVRPRPISCTRTAQAATRDRPHCCFVTHSRCCCTLQASPILPRRATAVTTATVLRLGSLSPSLSRAPSPSPRLLDGSAVFALIPLRCCCRICYVSKRGMLSRELFDYENHDSNLRGSVD